MFRLIVLLVCIAGFVASLVLKAPLGGVLVAALVVMLAAAYATSARS